MLKQMDSFDELLPGVHISHGKNNENGKRYRCPGATNLYILLEDKTAVVCDYKQYRVGVDIKSSESYPFLDILDKNRTKSHFLELSFPGVIMNHSCGFILALPYDSGSAMDYTPEGYDHVMLQTCFVDTGKTKKLTTANNVSCRSLSVPNCHATRRKQEGWDTVRLPKPRQGKSRGRGYLWNQGNLWIVIIEVILFVAFIGGSLLYRCIYDVRHKHIDRHIDRS
ncbi:hypothetical protein CLF_111792 [Clonorchis sinensis]|uniref:Uncharacterized protein n=1 Tax=Clonorchis sinensis TaxID=79923 RepID=G7YM00_CLOSI|nr:hypothetical protein CLF_111792 [Clonorchis sinensis]